MPTLAILGPTAAGKSSLALEIAERRIRQGAPTEIVAVDAFTVYRGLDVGTAKPSPDQRTRVAHHMVDVLDPWEELTVADFQTRARRVIDEIRGRGASPLLVGGSGLYWRAVVDDLHFPPTDAEVRARIAARWSADATAAHTHLASLDAPAAARIDPANVRRTIRALEVIELTGRPFSTFDDGWQRHASVYEDLDVGYLEPSTELLRRAIHQRAAAMVAGGLLEEAARLATLRTPLSPTARQAIGYAEAFEVLEGRAAPEDLAEVIAARTWRYARRQRSWFRADPRCTPQDPDGLRRRLAGP